MISVGPSTSTVATQTQVPSKPEITNRAIQHADLSAMDTFQAVIKVLSPDVQFDEVAVLRQVILFLTVNRLHTTT